MCGRDWSSDVCSSDLVACTSDELPTRRVRALDQALRICEARRYSGEDVLLIVDSLSRYALALREVGLAADRKSVV